MKKRFAYFYFMKPEPDKIQQLVPEHIDYWKNRSPEHYLGGPFTDKSGGLITFGAVNLEEATRMIMNDPFVLNNVLESKWIKEWIVE